MKEDKVWSSTTQTLLAKKAGGRVRGQDYVNWAVQTLSEGFDSPSLALLAGLDIDKDFPKWEAEQYFAKVVSELGLIIPDDETILRRHLHALVTQIGNREVDPEIATECIHREVVSPLQHPRDLQAWCFLSEGLNPLGNSVIPKEEYRATIFEFAKKWLSEKSESE